MKDYKKKLGELSQAHNNRKRKSTNEAVLLFIAQATAETNSNVKWLIWLAGFAVTAGIGLLIALAIRGM